MQVILRSDWRALASHLWCRRGAALAATLFTVAALAGCGEVPSANVPLDPVLAATAANQAAGIGQVATDQSQIDAVENPLTSAVGDVDGIGGVETGGGLGDYGGVSLFVAQPFADLHTTAALGRSNAAVRAALAPVGKRAAFADSCRTQEEPGGGTLVTCVDRTGPGEAVVTLTRTWPDGPLAQQVQRFAVNDNGTPLEIVDDRFRSYHSLVTLRDGSTLDVSFLPQGSDFLADGGSVAATEIRRPAHGRVLSQTNAMTLDIGLVALDGDEVIHSVGSEVVFRNGASATLAFVDSDLADGFADGDEVTVTSVLTAPPSDTRVQSVTTSIRILVGILQNEADDRVEHVERDVEFDGVTVNGGMPASHVEFTPTVPVQRGVEPCGGHFERHATFASSRAMRSVDHVVDRVCEGGGTAQLDIDYSDGTATHRTTAWTVAHDATWTTTRRDGAVVTGTYTAATRRIVVDTSYPSGRDPVSTHFDGTGDPGAHTIDWVRTATHADAGVDSLVVHGEAPNDSTRTLSGYTSGSAGHVDFEMQQNVATGELTGSTSGPDDETAEFAIERRVEEEGWLLTFSFRDPSEDLTVHGSVEIDRDGSGCGTVTITQHGHESTVPVCFAPDGEGTVAAAAAH